MLFDNETDGLFPFEIVLVKNDLSITERPSEQSKKERNTKNNHIFSFLQNLSRFETKPIWQNGYKSSNSWIVYVSCQL